MIGSYWESTDSRRPGRVKVIHVTESGYALCAPRVNGKYRSDPKRVRMIRADRLNPKSHWKLVKAA